MGITNSHGVAGVGVEIEVFRTRLYNLPGGPELTNRKFDLPVNSSVSDPFKYGAHGTQIA